jgi:hypothetical protein
MVEGAGGAGVGRAFAGPPSSGAHRRHPIMSEGRRGKAQTTPATSLPLEPPRKRRFVAATTDAGWHCFTHQAAALEFADATEAEAVWALEQAADGRRSYIVASREDFWRRYKTLQPPFRHYYELIRSGMPCHLYLDLEFCRRTNPNSDGERMIGTLMDEVARALAAVIGAEKGVDVPTPPWRVVDLDSSTPSKFSRHVIISLSDGTAFADNSHVGRFVHALCSSLARRRTTDPRIAELFLAPPQADTAADSGGHQADLEAGETAVMQQPPPLLQRQRARVCFVDLSVYSRNRCFRLYKSSKFGKLTELLPTGMDETALYLMPHAEERELFMASLASNVPRGSQQKGAQQLLRIDQPPQPESTETADGEDGGASMGGAQLLLPRPPGDGGHRADGLRHGECPHAAIATAATNAWAIKSGKPARYHRWSMDEEAGKLTLVLSSENRWCAHVQRPHRSNGTYLRIDLRRRCFAQFCFDAECRAQGFRGSDVLPLPAELCDALLPAADKHRVAPGGAGGTAGCDGVLLGMSADEALANMPLDEIVAAHRAVQHAAHEQTAVRPTQQASPVGRGQVGGGMRGAAAGLLDAHGQQWGEGLCLFGDLSDEALRSHPLDDALTPNAARPTQTHDPA